MPRKKDKLQSFTHVLRETLRMDDREWQFGVPSLPSPQELESRQLIKEITLSTKGQKQDMLLKLEPVHPNRAISGEPLCRFVLISFANFRPPGRHADGSQANALQPATPKECTDYITRLLRTGVWLNGVNYNFYGHSNSQLKSRTCYLFAASKSEINLKIEALGDFTKMKTAAKKAKRIGLLFSVANVATIVDPRQCEDISDVETADYLFTDGCGLISPRLARELARRTRIVFRDRRYTPSVFQIRYRGYKGVVTLDLGMNEGPVLLKLRKSMKKFSGGDDYSFSVVEYSKPYTFGFLNDEIIILLSALGIGRAVFLSKQEEHFAFLNEATLNHQAAFRFLCSVNMPEVAERLLMESLEAVQSKIRQLVNAEYAKMLRRRHEQKCRILIPKSRLLFGVCDAWSVLREGECAVRITMDGDGVPRTLINTEVLVTRNPCLHPGDLQKFRAVERHELAHLVDCIVFPTQGNRPAADMMSGGDLDGDTFFVCWDSDIIPSTVSQPAEYPGAREPVTFKPISDDDRLVYFAKYTNASLGRVKNLYLDWARVSGPMSPECQQLNRLFSQCVDGVRINIPDKLQKAPRLPPDAPPFILDELHEAGKRSIRGRSARTKHWDGDDFEALEIFLASDDLAMSEFEAIRLALRWCKKNDTSLEDLLNVFNFDAITAEEKRWVLAQIPPSRRAPSLVLNALCSSNLLREDEVRQFQLHHPGIRWQRLYTSSHDRQATFLDRATRALQLFHRKLLVFRVDERLTLAIYVPQKIDPSRDCVVDDRVRVFAFPHSQGPETQSRLVLPTKKNYRLYCDENNFQLFEGQRGNTWVFITRGPSDDSEYRNTRDKGDRRRQRQSTIDRGLNFDNRASVALNKFSSNLQRHVGMVNRNGISGSEIYIISNRDARSMQNLDLWLDYIDTAETLPLFDQGAKEYTVPTVGGQTWSSVPEYITRIARDNDMSGLAELQVPGQLIALFAWLNERDQKGLLLQCYDHLLAELAPGPGRERQESIAEALLRFLGQAPFLAVAFGRSASRDDVDPEKAPPSLPEGAHYAILKALILSANEAGELVVAPLESFLSAVEAMTLSKFADLIQLVALTVRSTEVALDLLLGCLEREGSRVLPGDPAMVRHFVRNLVANALDHIGEAAEQSRAGEELLKIRLLPEREDGYAMVELPFRIDSRHGTPEKSAHIRLTAASLPANVVLGKPYSIDALVVHSEQGRAKAMCLHPLPPFFADCSWEVHHCGSFATTKTMFDAIRAFAVESHSCCGVVEQLLGLPPSRSHSAPDSVGAAFRPSARLNPSQKAAVEAVLTSQLTCLWGPPGTGKTETIVEMILALQSSFNGARILVTAPTHNAVDNVMRRYMARAGSKEESQMSPLRVSTDVRKVADDLKRFTCDAMVGEEIYSSPAAMKQAAQRIKACEVAFTTCIGAGLGLLRGQNFDVVIIDEASQQTEPASLVPLVKGCHKAVLVGDHVQLRPTVQPIAQAVEADVSLFERLYRPRLDDAPEPGPGPDAGDGFISRLMLDTQYRMHEAICEFSSKEFYEGKLRTGIKPDSRPLPISAFPWPTAGSAIAGVGPHDNITRERMVLVECGAREDFRGRSKSNQGQANLCLEICKLLCTAVAPAATAAGTAQDRAHPTQGRHSIGVLTPYAKQVEVLGRLLSGLSPDVEVSSIDGFQGREADIVVLVTVRCNEHHEIGFLKDLRRMNVALTRARAGLIVIGNRATLTAEGGTAGQESAAMWNRLLQCLSPVALGQT